VARLLLLVATFLFAVTACGDSARAPSLPQRVRRVDPGRSRLCRGRGELSSWPAADRTSRTSSWPCSSGAFATIAVSLQQTGERACRLRGEVDTRPHDRDGD